MQTTQATSPPKSKARAAKLLYPNPDQHPERLFWLAMYFRDVAHSDAMKDLINEQRQLEQQPPDLVFHALYAAITGQSKEIKATLAHVIKEGTLLFAHPLTTIFDQPVAA